MELNKAQKLARELLSLLSPHCDVQIVGSVAKGKRNPKDIDLLIKTSDYMSLHKALNTIPQRGFFPFHVLRYKDENVDLFYDNQSELVLSGIEPVGGVKYE